MVAFGPLATRIQQRAAVGRSKPIADRVLAVLQNFLAQLSRPPSGSRWVATRCALSSDEYTATASCDFCAYRDQAYHRYGVRYYTGRYADVYLSYTGVTSGYSFSVFKRGHVTELTNLDRDTAAQYWTDTLTGASAIAHILSPSKLNYLTLGNSEPHLHTHIVPRFSSDPASGSVLPFKYLHQGCRPKQEFFAELHKLVTFFQENDPH